MRRFDRAIAIISLVILAACTAASPEASPTSPPSAPSATGTPGSASPSAEPSDVPSAEPIPSDDLGDFTCDPPIVEDATVPMTVHLIDVRVGTHDGYDRVVFEFEEGLPESSLDRATPPFAQDASGLPLDVDGESFLRLIMRGGTKQQDDGTSSYDGPRDIHPADFPTLVHLIEGGDFEAQSTWYLGLSNQACVRVTYLTEDGPPRLVIDVEN